MRQHRYYVYILANAAATVFYVGVTNDFQGRIAVLKNDGTLEVSHVEIFAEKDGTEARIAVAIVTVIATRVG